MSTAAPRPGGPSVGLPDGVFLAPLGRRLVAYLIDAVLPYLLLSIAIVLLATGGPTWLAVMLFLLLVGWAVVLWWMYAVKAAGPGMRLLGLQVVGLKDGRPLGFVRALLRGVLLTLLSVFNIVLIVMAVLMLQQPRRQGWHDLAVDSVVIEQRPLAPPLPGQPTTVRELVGKVVPTTPRPEPAQRPESRPVPVEGQQSATPAEPVEGRRVTISEHPEAEAQAPAPVAAPAPTPAEAAPEPVTEAAAEPGAPLPLNQGWVAVLDDGREIAITRLTLFGRNPQPRAGEEDAQLIKVADPDRTVSKTHLALTVDSRGLLVIDRGSTNGSAVTDPFGVYQLLTAEEPMRLGPDGWTVSFGKHQLRITRPAP